MEVKRMISTVACVFSMLQASLLFASTQPVDFHVGYKTVNFAGKSDRKSVV